MLILDGVDVSAGQTWYHVRLPILPNNSTGWVPTSALGNVYRSTRTSTSTARRRRAGSRRTADDLHDPGRRRQVRTGRRRPGQFYIRDKLTNFNNPFYGPLAFGTSARSAVLTDWPGGGFIGVHGTNEPDLIPGYISHGCIRLANATILKLARLMTVGTPLTVT